MSDRKRRSLGHSYKAVKPQGFHPGFLVSLTDHLKRNRVGCFEATGLSEVAFLMRTPCLNRKSLFTY